MKIKTVPRSWLNETGMRLDCNPYLSGGLDAKMKLEALECIKEPLGSLTTGIYHAGREGRLWVGSSEYGVPFMGSTDILKSDISNLPFLAKRQVERNPSFKVKAGWTLITRSGSIGRMAYARSDMDGYACSEHVMRVVPDEDKVPSGYVYAFLNSKFGVPQVISGTYGSIIQSIEPHHINRLPVPRFSYTIEQRVHKLIKSASQKRTQMQRLLNEATSLLFESAGVTNISAEDWHSEGPDIGFSTTKSSVVTMRALNFNPRKEHIFEQVRSVEHRVLGDICKDGHLGTGTRFKRIDADEEHGVCLVGQKQGFWVNPKGRWISAAHAPSGIFVEDESVLIASSGTLGEKEVYCRPIFTTGKWLDYAYTEHFFRVVTGDPEISGAYLFAFLRSELAFRCLRSISTGSKQQELHPKLIKDFPVPIVEKDIRISIEQKVREAFVLRDQADEHEAEAIFLVEETIEGAK